MEPRAMDSDKNSVRLRAACDRCHSQKLRCPKPAGAEVCDRCQRAGRPCAFSPFRQKKEPGRAHEKASMNTQLFHLEEKIDSMTEKSKRSLVGVKRKRNTLTPPRDCGWYPSIHPRLDVHADEVFSQALVPNQPLPKSTPRWMHVYFFQRDLDLTGHATHSRSTSSVWTLHLTS